MFEVVEPQLEGDEVFDSSLLKQMIESMIAAGKRNICVDLAGQDYLYSDTINALIGINKRMLDVMGRLSLVAPQPPVLEILKKGGIANILKIFENDDELMRVSQQLMGGAPPVASAPAAPPAPQEPQSEFDELRSEIGSAFGNIAPPPQQRMEAAPPQSPFADASFPTYRTPQQPRQAFPPPLPAGPAPRYAPPPPPLRPIEPAAQKPVPRPVVPPPPPIRPPAVPLTSGAETRRMPSIPEAPVPPAPPAGKQQPHIEPVAAPQAEADLATFEATLEKKPLQPGVQKRDRFDDDVEVKKKRSFVPVLVTLVLLIGLGAGGYYAYTSGMLNKSESSPAVTPPPETTIPQVPVPAPEPAVTQPADTAPVAAPAVEPAPEKKPETSPATPAVDEKAAAAKEAAAKVAAQKAAAAREAAVKAAAAKAAATKESAAKAAAGKAAAREAAAKAAAEKAALAKEAAAKVAADRDAAMKAAAARGAAAREAAAAKAAEPPPAPRPSTIEVIDEPASPPPPPPKPVVSAPPPPAPDPEPVESAASETGTIFMSSNPPLADVYLDGKLIGKTSIKELTVPTGTHTVRLVKGDKEMTKQMTFQPGKNPSVFIPIK